MVAMRDQSQIPVLGRILWMMVGPAMMALCLVGTMHTPRSGWLNISDGLYGVALAATIFGRWVEFQGGDPRTATYEPATAAHLRRYTVAALAVSLAVWLTAKLINNYVQ